MTAAAEQLASAHGSHLGLPFAKGAVLKWAVDVEFIHSLIIFINANEYSSGFLTPLCRLAQLVKQIQEVAAVGLPGFLSMCKASSQSYAAKALPCRHDRYN